MSQILSSALIVHNATFINIVALINQINKEAKWLKSWRTHGHSGQGEKKDGTIDEALAAISFEGGKKHCHKGNCNNCKKPGHWARKCCSTKKEKDESTATLATQTSSTTYKPKNKPVGSANAIMVQDFEGDAFWMAEEEAIIPAPHVSTKPNPMLGTIEIAAEWLVGDRISAVV